MEVPLASAEDYSDALWFTFSVSNSVRTESLERHKIYRMLADREAAKHDQVRIVDESGDDYLYPASYFASIELPKPLRKAVLSAG